MSKYIEAEWLKELYKPYENYNGKELSVPIGTILANIEDAPTIDIVYCRECAFRERIGCPRRNTATNKDNDFCSKGKREGEQRTMSEQLKQCPFCGSKKPFWNKGGWIECPNCHIFFQLAFTNADKEENISWWNTRAKWDEDE